MAHYSSDVAALKPNWINISVLTLSPLITIAGLALYIPHEGVRLFDVGFFIIAYVLTGLAVTAGYHRYYSHRAFHCHPAVQWLFLVFGASAMQNSLLHWASDHRNHHRFVDQEKDPYNIKKGFFWAHMGWIFFDDSARESFDNVKDLAKQPMVQWQHRYYVPIAVIVGLVLPFLVGYMFGRPWAGLLWGGLVRMVACHHSTFLINSAAHVFGHQPHSNAHSARDSWWLPFVSFGEGYHNYHHTYPSDYRNGAAWYHWDITKWLIGALSWVGLAWGLRRSSRRA